MRRLTILIALTLTLAACMAGSNDSGESLDSGGAAAPEETDTGSDERADFDVDVEGVENRRVIKRASLQLHATDTRELYDLILATTEASGGFVADATVYPVSGENAQPEITMTLRVPADRLNETLELFKGHADEVVTESQNAQDVTEQFVDLEARLGNLEALEVELRALLTEVRSQANADPEKLLTVFRELSSVREQIEQLQGQLNYLGDLTALATVDVRITQTPSAAPITEQAWEPAEQAKASLRSLVNGLQGLADWAINLVLYVLPLLILVLAIPVTAGVIVYRRTRARRKDDREEERGA